MNWENIFTIFEKALEWLAENKWVYLAYWIPFGIFSWRLYSKNKTGILNSFFSFVAWARPSLESNNHASPEKLTSFMVMNFVYIPSRLYFIYKIDDPIDLLWGNLLDVIFMLILYKIITPTQILELKRGLPQVHKEVHKEIHKEKDIKDKDDDKNK